MNPSNRTIEEKLAIVQQLRNNSNAVSGSKTITNSYKGDSSINAKHNTLSQSQDEDNSHFHTFLIIRLVICIIIFGIFAFIGYKNPSITQYFNTMITTEENGNLIDFMSPFTYTLQENVERTSETDAESENKDTLNMDMSSEE